MRTKIKLIGPLSLFLLLTFAVVSNNAEAVVINAPNMNITVEGTAMLNSGVWEYRYTITDTQGVAVSPVRLVINESPPHAGLHHEFNFLTDGGKFSYDFASAVPWGLSAHNYFWNDLSIAANSSIIVGFDDIHGPTNASWGIQARGQYVDLGKTLPVPVPEPSAFALLVSGLLGFRRMKKNCTNSEHS